MNIYQKSIVEVTGCLVSEVDQVEEIMRNDIFNSTLDQQTMEHFNEGALEAYEIFRLKKKLNKLSRNLFGQDYFCLDTNDMKKVNSLINLGGQL